MTTTTAVDAEIAFLAPCTRRPVLRATPSDEDYLPLEKHAVSISAIHGERADLRLGRDGVEIVPGRAVPDTGSARSAGRPTSPRSKRQWPR